MNDNGDYLNRKSVGKVNLSLWEQNASSQSKTNTSSAKNRSPDENKNQVSTNLSCFSVAGEKVLKEGVLKEIRKRDKYYIYKKGA
jgi:hypothetical protein